MTTSGSTVLVTGAARGIGAEVATHLAGVGHRVAAVDLRGCDETVRRITASGGTALGWTCDVRSEPEVRAVVTAAETELGPLQGLAAVHGVWVTATVPELTLEVWQEVLDVNLTGSFVVCKAVADALLAGSRPGALICVSSNSAQLAWAGGAHYSASKAGLLGMVRGFAFELGRHGIRVNAVCPGTVLSPSTRDWLADPEVARVQDDATALGRIGRPRDVATAIEFLLDMERASWITGETLVVDGGYGIHGVGAGPEQMGLIDTSTGAPPQV